MNDWITSTEAAGILGMSPQWLRDMATANATFPRPYQPGMRKLFWSRAAIIEFRDKSIVPLKSATDRKRASAA